MEVARAPSRPAALSVGGARVNRRGPQRGRQRKNKLPPPDDDMPVLEPIKKARMEPPKPVKTPEPRAKKKQPEIRKTEAKKPEPRKSGEKKVRIATPEVTSVSPSPSTPVAPPNVPPALTPEEKSKMADDALFKRPLDPPPRRRKKPPVPPSPPPEPPKKPKKQYKLMNPVLPPFPHSGLPIPLPPVYERPTDFSKHKLPKNVRPELLEELRMLDMEEEMLRDGSHPEITALEKEIEELEKLFLRNIETSIEKDKRQFARRFDAAKAVVDREVEIRAREINRVMKIENDERFKTIDAEVAAMTLEGPAYVPPPVSKKSLRSSRGRGSDHGSTGFSIEPKGKGKKAGMPPVSHLLQESEIYRDLRKLGKLDSNVLRHVVYHKTALDNHRLVYEGKSYTRGQPLFIRTEQFPMFPAMIMSMCESWVQFKSTMPGDTRNVTATPEDLETGRVFISKKAFA